MALPVSGLMRVFPARAGMIPPYYGLGRPRNSIPRESGDDPVAELIKAGEIEYSPRERG